LQVAAPDTEMLRGARTGYCGFMSVRCMY
jgi:hypothetical protein